MAKKKKPASLPEFKQPLDLGEAQKALNDQIAAWRKILDQQPSSEEQFKATRQQMNAWRARI